MHCYPYSIAPFRTMYLQVHTFNKTWQDKNEINKKKTELQKHAENTTTSLLFSLSYTTTDVLHGVKVKNSITRWAQKYNQA